MTNHSNLRSTPTPRDRMRTGIFLLFLALVAIEVYVLYQAWSGSFALATYTGQMLVVNTMAAAFAGALVVIGFRETRTGA